MGLAGLLVWFLVSQGLNRAAAWATVLELAVSVLAAVIAVWTLVVTIQSARTEPGNRPDGRVQLLVGLKQVNKSGANIAHTGDGDIHYQEPQR